MIISEQNIARLVHDHILGIISDEDEQELQAWLEADTSHRRIFERLMSRNDLARRYRQYASIDSERAWQSFSHRSRKARRMTLLRRVAAIAAVAVIAIAGAAYIWHINQRTAIENNVVAEKVQLSPAADKARQTAMKTGRLQGMVVVGNKTYTISSPQDYARILAEVPADEEWTVSTKQDKEYWLTLSDGTQVHLDNHSSLKYPAVFSDSHRDVALTGTAWFKVAHGKAPFSVSTPDGVITDLGTEFLVSTRGTHGNTDVVLFEGKVGVSQNGGTEIPLKPGQKAELSHGGINVEKADLDAYRAWNEGEFLFQDVTLEEMMDVVAHWYDVDVVFKNQSYSRMTFTGSIDRYGTLDGLLKALRSITGLPIHQEGKRIIIG